MSPAPALFRIINEDTGDVLFDFTDPAGTVNTRLGGLKTKFGVGSAFDLGSTEETLSEFSPDSAPGGFVTKVTPTLTTSSWRQSIIGPDYPTMVAGANELQRLLRIGGVIAVQMHSADDPKFIDYEPWKVPALFRGDAFEGFFRSSLFRDDGLPIELRRQPYLRGYQVDSSKNLLLNGSLLKSTASNRPAQWSWDSTTGITSEGISVPNERYEFHIATTANRTFSQVQAAVPAQFHVFSAYLYGVAPSSSLKLQLQILYYASTDGTGSPLATVASPDIVPTSIETRYVLHSVISVPSGAPVGTQSVRFQIYFKDTDASSNTVGMSRFQAELGDTLSVFREASQAVPNNPVTVGGRAFPIHVVGSQPTPVDLIVTGESGANLKRVIVGARSNEGITGRNNLVDLLNATRLFQCKDGTLGVNASTVTGGSLPAGAMATTDVKVVPADTQLVRRLRIPITTLLDSLRGNFTPYLRFSSATADVDYTIQAYWSFSGADPAPYPNLRYSLPLNGTGAAGAWFELPLGEIVIPDNLLVTLSGISIDIYIAASVTGKSCYLDVVTLVPSDRLSEMFVALTQKQSWLGSELLGGTSITSKIAAGTIDGSVAGTEYLIDAVNESCGLAPAAGLPWQAGHHLVRLIGHGPPGIKYAPVVRFGVRNVTDSTNKPDTVNTIDFSAFPGYLTLGSSFSYELEFQSASGKLLQPQVIWWSGQPATYISRIEHEFVAAVQQNERIQSDFLSYEIEKLNADGTIAQYGSAKGRWPVWCDPGLNVLIPIFEDVGVTGAPDVSVDVRNPVVGFSYKPRWFQ